MKVIFLLLNIPLVLGQAPGDFQQICRTDFRYRPFHDWIPYVNDTTVGVRGDVKWQILVDQNDYEKILREGVGSHPVWTRRDVDGDGHQIDSSGTICTNGLQIRNTYINPNSSNWVFTQSVSYLDAIEVIVNATIRFRGCHQRSSLTPPCRNNFVILHRYDTNSTRPSNEINNTTNYQPCFGDRTTSRFEDSSGSNTISVIKRFARPNFNMTYFGIQDIGSYGDVQRMMVYYRVAQGYEEGLVRCPTIALPREGSSDTVSKSCTCKENAIPMNNMELRCPESGVCQGSPMCQCRAGYEGQSDCQACSSGTYRSLDRTNCVPCPQQSTSGVAASKCSCVEGTYRAQSETAHNSCTSPPSKPRSVTQVPSNVTCTIRWVAPSDNGGRSDTFYNITYMELGSISGSSRAINTTSTNVVIRNLKPVTTYRIRITAENGVSANEVSLDQLQQRTATETCTTTEGVPDKPSGVEVIDNLLLIWQKPDTANGVITGYAVHITFTPFHNPITRNLVPTRLYFIFRQSGIPANVTVHVQVRARTARYDGKWSTVISFTPTFGQSCPDTCPRPEQEPLVFRLGGTTYPNNTVVLLEDIGEGDNALLCVSNNTRCCDASYYSFQGEFYYPNGTMVPTQSAGHSVYRNREASYIRFNQRGNAVNSPLGRYRCDIIDDTGARQSLYINFGTTSVTTCPTPTTCEDCPTPTPPACPTTQAPSPTSVIRVIAIVNVTIVRVDAPTFVLNKIDKFEVQITSEDEWSMRKRQTKKPITFTVKNTGQLFFKIPSDQLNTLRKGSIYSVKVKPLFKNNTQGEYGPSYTFQFKGATRDALTSTGEGQVDMKFIALAILLTFLITTIIVTLLVLALVWLFMTCREKRSAKCNGSDKPMKLANFYGNKNDNQ